MLPSTKSAKAPEDQVNRVQFVLSDVDVDAEFGGKEARCKLEQELLRKLDMRMSMLILVYILNFVCLRLSCLERHARTT